MKFSFFVRLLALVIIMHNITSRILTSTQNINNTQLNSQKPLIDSNNNSETNPTIISKKKSAKSRKLHLKKPRATHDDEEIEQKEEQGEEDKPLDLANGEELGRRLMLSEVEYPQIGIVNLDSGDFLLNIS